MPIAMRQEELARIRRWTDAGREEAELARRRDYVRYLDLASRQMTKTWPNSLENVNKRNEEVRQARLQVAEQANANFYKLYLKRRKEEQERLMFSARDTVFKNKDAPKLLLSAVIETCVQKERGEQLKFRAERAKEAAERKRKEDDETISKAKEWERFQANQRKLRFEADKKHQQEILEQAHEVAERNRSEHEAEVNMQRVDNLKASQQMDALNEFEENFKQAEKARIWADMAQAARENEARRAETRARDAMDDRLIHVLNTSRARVERRRKQTEKEIKDAKLKVLERISQKLESGDAARNQKEQEMLDKARKERDAVDEKRRQQQAEKLAEMKRERTEQRRQWERDEADRLHRLDTQLHWDIMNRFKNVEINEDFQEKLRQEKAQKIKEYREEILRLWKEREDREAREKAETRHFYGELALKKLRDADNQVLTHAKELIEEARVHGRPDLPLRKAVDLYCRLYRLYPMPELPASLKEHFQRYSPTDGSQPDPEYRPPQPPASKPSHDLDSILAPAAGSNGLQDDKPVAAMRPQKKEEMVEDYKRAAKANGLQRKNAQHELTLPPITVLPCKNETCSCPLK